MLEDALYQHLRVSNPFPRGVGYESGGHFRRPMVKDMETLIRMVKLYGESGFYINIFSKEQMDKKIIDTIWLDVDGNKGDKPDMASEHAYMKLIEVKDVLKAYHPRYYYSGVGFHIWLDIEPIPIKHYYSLIAKFLDNHNLLNGSETSLIDRQTIDFNRVSRCLYTKNLKSGLYCIPIYPEWDLKYIKKLANNPSMATLADNDAEHYRSKNKNLRKELIEINENIKEVVNVPYKNGYRIIKSQIDYPPCIQKYLTDLLTTGELDHLARLQLSIFLLKLGKDKTYIKDLFKKAKDYKASKTDYQLDYIKRRELKCYCCNKMRDMKLCPTKICPFYPSLNLWI